MYVCMYVWTVTSTSWSIIINTALMYRRCALSAIWLRSLWLNQHHLSNSATNYIVWLQLPHHPGQPDGFSENEWRYCVWTWACLQNHFHQSCTRYNQFFTVFKRFGMYLPKTNEITNNWISRDDFLFSNFNYNCVF